MNIEIDVAEGDETDYLEFIIEQIINSTNNQVDPVQQAALDIADSISTLGQSISNLGNAIRSEIIPRPIVIPIPSLPENPSENGLESFVTQILQMPSIQIPFQDTSIPSWLFDPTLGSNQGRTTVDIDRLNDICPEEEGDSIECDMECNGQVTLQRKLPCDHVFCSVCIVRWMTENSNTCPICRQIVN